MKIKTHNRGFTLIEALVVIFIIGLVSAILIVNWRRNEKQYQVQRIAQEIVQNIRRAQDMALNSFKYGTEVPYSYGIFFDKNDKDSYIIFGDKNNDNIYKTSDIKIEEILIESGVRIDSLSSGNKDLNITFTLPDGFTNINPAAVSAIVIIKNTDGSRSKTIVVRKTGQVNIEP